MGATPSIDVSSFGRTLINDADAATARETLLIPRKNKLINGDFFIAQRGTTITAATVFNNNDDSYTLDMVNLLSDGNDIVDVSRILDVDGDSTHAMKAVVQTNNKKFAFVRYLEASDSIRMRGKRVSLSFRAKTTAAKVINNIRAAVITWEGAIDTLTSDVISVWGAQGVNPTLSTDWTFKNTATDFALSTSYQKFTIPNILLDAPTINNLAVIIWVDDTDAAGGDELILKEIQLEENTVVTEFEVLPLETKVALARRFFQKSFDLDSIPAPAAGGGGSVRSLGGDGTGRLAHYVYFSTVMRKIPTMVGYNPTSSNIKWRNLTDGTDHAGDISFAEIGNQGFSLVNGTDDAAAATDMCAAHWTADAEL